MATLEELKVLISAKDEASKALRNVRGRFSDLEKASRALMRALGPLAGALAVREIIDSAVSWERYELALRTVLGTQEAANQELDWLRGVADNLGLDIETVAGSYAKLAAATKNTAIEGEGTRDIFFAVSGAMAKLGQSSADTEGALTALSQMVSKGKVSAEELRQQLGERMPGAFQLFADAAGVSTAELDKMLQKGEVGIDLLPKFADEVNKAFSLDINTRIESAQAAMNRFNNSLLDLKLSVADAGLLDAFTGSLQAVQSAIEDEGLLDNLALLGDSFRSIGDDGDGFELFLKGLVEVFKVFSVGVMTVVAPIKLLGEMIGATAAAISLAVEGEFTAAKAALMDSRPADKFKEDLARIEEAVGNLGSSFKETGESAKKAAPQIEENTKKTEDNAKASALAAEKARQDAEAKELQAKQAHEAAMKMAELAVETEKIASNERIQKFEIAVDFQIEKVKADAAIMKSVIDGVSTAIESTGQVMTSLTDDLLNASSFSEKWFLEDLIKSEEKRREDSFKLQKNLTEAQVELIDARTAAMKSGDALITINGDGLAPELEAFMWKILETIQIRAADEESAFLLGI